MTHPYKKSCHDASDSPSLPDDYAEKSAYMRLYRAWQLEDDYWPREAFGDEMTLLIDRGHAEVHGEGYRLTTTGRIFWRAFQKRYARHSDAMLHETDSAVAS